MNCEMITMTTKIGFPLQKKPRNISVQSISTVAASRTGSRRGKEELDMSPFSASAIQILHNMLNSSICFHSHMTRH